MAIDLNAAKKLVTEINSVVESLDETVRARAFDVLVNVALEGAPSAAGTGGRSGSGSGKNEATTTDDLGEFLGRHDHDKPSDNVRLIVAYLWSQYGQYPMSIDEIRQFATEAGLTIPDRVDMTIRAAKANGKALFRSPKRSHYQLTVHGERYMKDTYEVTKGTKPRPVEDDE